MNIINKILGSFDNSKDGFSARKLSAFVFVLFSAYIHINYISTDNAIEALFVDSGTLLLCLGIITMEQIIKFKNGDKQE